MTAVKVVIDSMLRPASPEAELPPGATDVLHLPQHFLQSQKEGQDHQEDTPPVLKTQRDRQVQKDKEDPPPVLERQTGQCVCVSSPQGRRNAEASLGGWTQRWRQSSKQQ